MKERGREGEREGTRNQIRIVYDKKEQLACHIRLEFYI